MSPAGWLHGWSEPATLALMLACFGALAIWRRWPIGIALLVAAWLGEAAAGDWLPARHLVEGAFSYLDPILVIATAMIFMRLLADGGALAAIGRFVELKFGQRPALLLPILMLIVMFPGMITGSSTASVLTTGSMVGSILIGLGLSRERAGAVIAMGGVLVVITGCAHAGICNTIDYARTVCEEPRVVAVIGGFHLQKPSRQQLAGTLSYFERLRPESVLACHCTDLQSKIALAGVANVQEVGVGLAFEYR